MQLTDRLSSMLWQCLRTYGRIKYRYLLPVYNLFGIDGQKAEGTRSKSKTARGVAFLTRVLSRSSEGSYRNQLESVIERVRASRGAIIFLPSVGWQIPNAQRVHHLAREFARAGFVSVFDCTNAFDDVDGFKEIEPAVFLFRGPDGMLAEIPDAVLWSLTFNFDRRDEYPASARVVYDWVDDLDVFPFDRGFLERNHERALREATIVSSVARRLHEQALGSRPDAVYLPNAVEYSRFADESAESVRDPAIESLRREGRPVAGYYGAMAEWFDYELLEAVAAMRGDWNFLLIGPAYDDSLRERGKKLLKRKNVQWIGSRPYQSLPGYLRLFDVAMIPFVINHITLSTSPLKLYEYFAAAKPVVTTRMPECMSHEEVRVASSAEEFSRSLDLARADGEDEHFRERLKEAGRKNSWAARVETVTEHLTSP